MSKEIPNAIARYVQGYVARRRVRALLLGMGWAMVIGLAWGLLACAMDRWMGLNATLRMALLAIGVIGVIAALMCGVVGAMKKINWINISQEIERRNPEFGERLRTVVSQLMEREQYRGSPAMLSYLVDEVSKQVGQRRARFDWGMVKQVWLGAGVLLIAAALLISGADGRVLARRLVRPGDGVAAVTSTRIAVTPGDERLMRGKPLIVRAQVMHLSGGGVDICTSQDGQSWTRMAMLPVAEHEYMFTLAAMERNLKYFVQAGDATSETYSVSVIRPPAVAEYRVRYEFPAYTQRAPLTISNTDGLIEGVVGTKVTLALVASEALKSAEMRMEGQKIPLTPTSDPHVVQTEFILNKSAMAELALVSSEGLAAELPARLTIRAQSDREPVARLIRPVEDLRLHQRDLLPIQYLAMDDFGIATLSVVVQVNSKPVQELPIRKQGDPRRQEGQFVLDLAKLNVQVGDVVQVGLSAADGTGKKISSERMRRILISPRSIDLNTHLRIAEMKQAGQLASAHRQGVESAAEAVAKLSKKTGSSEAEPVSARLGVSRNLSSAVEAGLLLHQSLLRVVAKSSSVAQTMGLAECIDRARVQTFETERAVAMDAGGSDVSAMMQKLVDGARHVEGCVRILSEGEQAAAILADRANVKAAPASQPTDKASADRLRETRRRAEQDIAFAVEELGLAMKTPELDKALAAKVEAAKGLMNRAKPVEFEISAKEWSEKLLQPVTHVPLPLAERLASASTVEALRPDSDPIRARDLQMASRAAARLAEAPISEEADANDPVKKAIGEFPGVIVALAREHGVNRHPADVRPPEELKAIRDGAAAARMKLKEWAKMDLGAGVAKGDEFDLEEMAFEASARTVKRDYNAARSMDEKLAREDGEGYERIRRGMGEVAAIDNASDQQRKVSEQTAGEDVKRAGELAGEQRRVAEQIKTLESGGDMPQVADSRPKIAAVLASVQENLARMPQQMAAAMEAAENYRQSMIKSEAAAREAANAPAEKAGMAKRMAEQAAAAMKESLEILNQMAGPVAAEEAEKLAKILQGTGSEGEEASVVVGEQLQAALTVFGQSMRAGDKGAVERAGQHVRVALERAQGALREAQAGLIERDPIAAARWYASAAAAALDERPPDFRKAKSNQESTAMALSRAWQTAMREAGVERLILTPSFRPLLRPQVIEGRAADGNKTATQVVPGLRQWGYLPTRSGDTLSAPIREVDAPGYQEPLKLYFEALNKAQDKSDKK